MKCKKCGKEIPYNPYIKTKYCCKWCELEDNWDDAVNTLRNLFWMK